MPIPKTGKLDLINAMPGLGAVGISWREILIRFALIFICLGLWKNGLNAYTFSLLSIAWILDGGLHQCKQLLKEPLIQGILLFCSVLALGLLWGDLHKNDQVQWARYFFLLNFIPFFSLLKSRKERLYWASGALLLGAVFVFVMGLYQWLAMNELGVPFFKMSYLSFSAMLGIGALLSFYAAEKCTAAWVRVTFWLLTLLLLFVQFHQNGRGLLLSTLAALLFLVLWLYGSRVKKLLLYSLLLFSVILVYTYSSTSFQGRLSEVIQDFEKIRQGHYSTSIGYRIAMWDVGLHAIAKRPLLGYGTGMPASYFNEAIKTYKGGIYKDLPAFLETVHFHNDWIEVGMHTGLIGMLALAVLYWSWYRTFSKRHLSALGGVVVCFIFIAGLSDAFLMFSRIPILLIAMTAIVVCRRDLNLSAFRNQDVVLEEDLILNQETRRAELLETEARSACKLCGANGVTLYRHLEDSLFGVTGTWSFKQCCNTSCGLIWLDPMPARSEIWKAYQNYYTHDQSRNVHRSKLAQLAEAILHRPCMYILGLHKERKWYKQMFLESIPNGRLLEVGCGNGKRLARMRALGWRVVGQEIDPIAVQQVRDKLGIDVHLGELDTLLDVEKFDAIIISHVIEHVHDPIELLSTCNQLLKKEGVLALLTPNAASYGHKKFGANWRGLEPPRHLHLFTRTTLIKMAQNAGFSNNKCWTTTVGAYGIGQSSFRFSKMKRNGSHVITVRDVLRGICFQIAAYLAFKKQKETGEECVLMARK